MWCAGLGSTIRLLDLLGHAAGLQVLDVINFHIRHSVKLFRMSWIYEHLSDGVLGQFLLAPRMLSLFLLLCTARLTLSELRKGKLNMLLSRAQDLTSSIYQILRWGFLNLLIDIY